MSVEGQGKIKPLQAVRRIACPSDTAHQDENGASISASIACSAIGCENGASRSDAAACCCLRRLAPCSWRCGPRAHTKNPSKIDLSKVPKMAGLQQPNFAHKKKELIFEWKRK
jgi:hypothetical protein